MRPFPLLILVPLAATLAGCSMFTSSPTPPSSSPTRPVPASNPFAPVGLRVHPLTRTVINKEGKPELVVHLELRDAWGDSTKGVGALLIRVFGPASGPAGGAAAPLQRWDIDLSNLDTNAAMFDPATRTYRMQLTGAPDWLTELASTTPGKSKPRVILQATLTLPDGRAPLTDEHLLQR